MVLVKGMAGSTIATISELGLPQQQIPVTPEIFDDDIKLEAWGEAPADVQIMLGTVSLSIILAHFDANVLAECVRLSMAAPAEGQLPNTGQRMGNNLARFAAGNRWIGLNLSAPVSGTPWRFFYAKLTGQPYSWPLGAKRSYVMTNWKVIPYTQDPYGGITGTAGAGTTAQGLALWDHTLDT